MTKVTTPSLKPVPKGFSFVDTSCIKRAYDLNRIPHTLRVSVGAFKIMEAGSFEGAYAINNVKAPSNIRFKTTADIISAILTQQSDRTLKIYAIYQSKVGECKRFETCTFLRNAYQRNNLVVIEISKTKEVTK